MSGNPSARVALAVALLVGVPPAAAGTQAGDGGGEVTLDDLQRQADELGEQIEARRLELEKRSAYLGGREPWPRPDPELDVAAWRQAVLGAEAITAAEALDRSETVKVAVSRTPTFAAHFEDDADLFGAVVEACIGAGRHTDPDSELELLFTCSLGLSSFEFSRGGRSSGSATAHYLRTVVSLVLPARVLRAGTVRQVPLVLATTIHVQMWREAPRRSEVEEALTAAARKLLDKLLGATEGPPRGASVFGPWIGAPEDAERRRAEWTAAYVARRSELGPALEAVPGFGRLRIWDEAYREDWTSALAAAGFAADLPQAPDLRGELFFDPYPFEGRLAGGGVVTARSSVLERDAVGVLQDRYVRVAGASFVDVSFPRFGTRQGWRQVGYEVQTAAIQDFVRALGASGSREGQERHPDADAVANYLRTRTRAGLSLSDEFIAEISNRIALAIDSAHDIPITWKSKWKEPQGGQPMMDLARIGNARRAELVPRDVQAAVRRLIDDLTLVDPLGLYAFDELWSYDRSRMYNELPEGFAAELAPPRPSGPGALRRVYVDSGPSSAPGHRVLVCWYIPNDGRVGLSVERKFWYREAPPGWTGPDGGEIGPPREQAPRYLDEADALFR